MMDVLIRNLEKPKNCLECRFYLSEYDYCHALKDNLSQKEWETKSRCPLVELPPHGEAKDTDIAIKYIKSEMEDDFNETTTLDEKSYKEGMKRAIELIGYAPTILEASNG